MSTSLLESYALASKLVAICTGIPIFVAGVVGGILNIIVFLSLRTFRQSSCALYLTVMSIVNVGELFTAVLPSVLNNIYGSNWSESSLFYCKFRVYFLTICTTISWTCFCLATIDQYCATCSRPWLQQFSNIKLARWLVLAFTIIWILHATPYLIFYNHIVSSSTGKVVCTVTNLIFVQYQTYVVILVFVGSLPILISMLFGLMAYRNVQQLAYYTVPLVRRELDKQLTKMVLTQVVMNCFTVLPFSIINTLQLNKNLNSDVIVKAQIQMSIRIIFSISLSYFASPFYVYISVSERFRRQLSYVLFRMHLNRCKRQPRILQNQVEPQT